MFEKKELSKKIRIGGDATHSEYRRLFDEYNKLVDDANQGIAGFKNEIDQMYNEYINTKKELDKQISKDMKIISGLKFGMKAMLDDELVERKRLF